jgi:hypothetical protein
LYALQPTIPHLSRSALHRRPQRHGISRLPEVGGDKPAKKRFKRYQSWSQNFGPFVKVDRLKRKPIQNDEEKEPCVRVQSQGCA